MKHTLNVLAALLTMLMSCRSNGQIESAATAKAFDHEDITGIFNEVEPNLSHVASIASKSEPGERLKITGIVYESDGKTPAENVQMYFYHTDARGMYAKRGTEPRNSFAWWHGYNRGSLTTNSKGEYEINTIKPAPYPVRIEPAHIHVIVKSPKQKKVYDVGAITFKGDELATPEYWYTVEQHGHPRDGGVELKMNSGGILEGKMNYVLYAQYDIASTNSGLLIGEECPAFSPQHAFGPDKGSKACPMCKYGHKQGVMAWVNTDDWSEMAKLAQFFETTIAEKGQDNIRAFIIYMNPSKLAPQKVAVKLDELGKSAGLKSVALLYIPSPDDNKSSGLYRINPNEKIKNTVLVFKERRVRDKFINFNASTDEFTQLTKNLSKTLIK
ncbi:MAG TPA: hypothetical protein VEZ55_17325 [Chitinophagaceae bacterium]|nr:hypothetical protein [Chitinophagaceae bacterium]